MSRYNYYNDNRRKDSKVIFGIGLALFGIVMFLRALHLFFFDFTITWPIILIVIGLMTGFKHRFNNAGAWILIAIGVANLIPEFEIHGTSSRHLIWPAALVLGGLLIAFRPRRNKYCAVPNMNTVTSTDGMLNVDVTFGGHKEFVTSKEFRGGNINATFGGCEINLMQADSSIQPMVLNMKVSFGGVEIIVPSHWELQIEVEPSFGSIEDHRMLRTPATGEEKRVLIIRGNCSFGSIEIKSY